MTKWIKCSERLPDRDNFYLAVNDKAIYGTLKATWFSTLANQFHCNNDFNLQATHWAYIEPPEAE